MRTRNIEKTLDASKVGVQVLKRKNGRVRVVTHCGEGKTEQAHKQACDMNYILEDYNRTKLLKHAKKHEGTYDDVSGVEFQEAMFKVKNAQNQFDDLPSKIRKKFNNDPVQFLDFVQNKDNKDEMIKMGILKGNDGLNAKGESVDTPTEKPKEKEADKATDKKPE